MEPRDEGAASRTERVDDADPRVDRTPASRRPSGRGDGARGLVQRLGWLMAAWAAPGVVLFLGRGDGRAALTLTLCLALSIVHLRSLQAQVSRLDPDARLRAGAVMVVRWGLLIVGLLAVLSFGVSRPFALAWGVLLLPVALITEAVLAALASRS